MDHINWYLNVKPALTIWDESHSVIVYHSFDILLGLIWLYCIEDFCVYIQETYQPTVFFSHNVMSDFDIRLILA